MDKLVEYFCKNCNKWVDVGVTVYSHDEYFCDEECSECGDKIPTEDQYKILDDSVLDYTSSKIDWAHDASKDR